MGTGNNSRIIGSFRHCPQDFKSGNEVHMAMMAATQASQASGSNAVGPSGSVTVDDEAVPGHSFLAMLHCPQPATIARKQQVAINPPPCGKQRSATRGIFDPKSVTLHNECESSLTSSSLIPKNIKEILKRIIDF